MEKGQTMTIYDYATGLAIGEPGKRPFPTPTGIEEPELTHAYENLILSSSGWRKVFAADGKEESTTEELTTVDKLLIARMARSFCDFLHNNRRFSGNTIIVGCDSRYTGPAIAEIMIRVFLTHGYGIHYLFITPVPEIMAYTRTVKQVAGFAYISASHNPVGHNGVKFGDSLGRIIGGQDSVELIQTFSHIATKPEGIEETVEQVNGVEPILLQQIFESVTERKKQALEAYARFSREVISDSAVKAEQLRFFSGVSAKTEIRPIGVLAELNGSARTTSIDFDFLTAAGITVKPVNGKPREISHQIVPEGAGLYRCMQELEKAHGEDGCFLFGYVPDNDGDRGNIVYVNEKTGKASPLEAQQVFALSCISELASLVYNGSLTYTPAGRVKEKAAIVVNGPTSLRIDRIAEAFGAVVVRCEVGEANVVSKADELRTQGYIVRIFGEGSNGGTITYPATVRDPLNTLFALIKLLTIETDDKAHGLFHIWYDRSRKQSPRSGAVSLTTIIDSLPAFCTTSVFEPRGALTLRVRDHRVLKAQYEQIFRRQFEAKKSELAGNLGIHAFEVVRYDGTNEHRGTIAENPAGAETGGYKVLLQNSRGREIGFLWMRGSKTEPVFRVMADIECDDPAWEHNLLDWHVSMLKEAEQMCGNTS